MPSVDRIVKRAIEIQRIPSPTFAEDARAEYMIDQFQSSGFGRYEIDLAGNVLMRVPGGRLPPLIISAHMDSVIPPSPEHPVTEMEGRIIGPGIGDNAVALATLLELGTLLKGTKPPGDVWLAANVAEEGLGNLLGMQHIVERFGDNVTGYLVLEGLSLGFVYHRALPVRRFRVSIQGGGGHSWSRSERTSSVHTLIKLGNDLLQVNLPQKPRTTLNVGRIEGGTSINALASQAAMELDLRSESHQVVEQVSRRIMKVAARFQDDGCAVRVEPIGHRPGGSLPRRHPFVQAAGRALQRAGVDPVRWSAGSTDASLPISLGLPAVCIGITRGAGAHSLHEHIEIEPIEQGLASVLNLVETAFADRSNRNHPWRAPNLEKMAA